MQRSNSDIVNGSILMLFVNDKPIAFATSHSLSMTANTTEISTKDHGAYPGLLAQTIGWELQTENLYSDAGNTALLPIFKAKQPVTVKFAKAGNWNDAGIVDNENLEWTVGNIIAQGKALCTSYSINAPSNDNATISATFTGVGELDITTE